MRVGIYFGTRASKIGGGNTFEAEILQGLLEHGKNSGHTFVLLSDAKNLPPTFQAAGHFEFHSLRRTKAMQLKSKISRTSAGLLRKLKHPLTRLKIENGPEKFMKEIIRAKKLDMIWSLVPDPLPTYDIPYITTIWDLQHRLQPYFPEVSAEGRWNYRERTYAASIRQASVILTGTTVGKNEIERFYQVAPERIEVVPFPTPNFSLNVEKNDSKAFFEKYKLPERYLFYPAQFWPHKNHANLLLALEQLRDKKQITLPVVFVGSDLGNMQYIKQLVKERQLEDLAFFPGYVPQEDLLALYQNAFALAFVSLFGPDNLPPLEAFALGCPVIATDFAGSREQLGEDALLVDSKNPADLAAAIETLWHNPDLRQQYIDRGLKRATRWTCSDYIESILKILDNFAQIRRCWSSNEPFQLR